MTKKTDDKIESIEEWIHKKEIEDGIRKGLNKWIRTICMTATSALMGAFYAIGGFMYQHWQPIQEAIKAYLVASRGDQ